MEFRDLSSGIERIIAGKPLDHAVCGAADPDCNALNQNVFAYILMGQSPAALSHARSTLGKLTGRGDTIGI
jgi:hypothetical protein